MQTTSASALAQKMADKIVPVMQSLMPVASKGEILDACAALLEEADVPRAYAMGIAVKLWELAQFQPGDLVVNFGAVLRVEGIRGGELDCLIACCSLNGVEQGGGGQRVLANPAFCSKDLPAGLELTHFSKGYVLAWIEVEHPDGVTTEEAVHFGENVTRLAGLKYVTVMGDFAISPDGLAVEYEG